MDSPSLKVLIVEDDPGHIAAILRAFKISRPQDTLHLVGSLMECRNFLAGQTPDIIITDIKLPDGSVFELLNILAVSRTYPVIVMTSYGNETVAVEAMKAGALDYVVKSPDSLNEMPHTVERVMREWVSLQEVKNAQEALAHSQAELRAVFDGTPVMLCVVDQDRRVLNSNRAFNDFVSRASSDSCHQRPCGILGCVRAFDDPAGCGFGPHCGECSLRIAMSDTLRTGTTHIDVECDMRLLLAGQERSAVFLGSTTPILPDGGVGRALVSLLDISARRQAEDDLRMSEEKISSILSAIDDGILSFLIEDSCFSYVSQSCMHFFGSNIEDKYGREPHAWVSFVHPDDIGAVYDSVMQLQEQGEAAAECRIVRFDGSVIWALARQKLIYDRETGQGKRYDLMLTDITERKRAEQKLRESEALLARSQQVAHIGSWQLEVSKQEMIWSDELYSVLGLTPGKHPPTYGTFFEIVHPDDMPPAQVAFSDFFNGNNDSLEYVHRIIRKDTAEVRYVYERCVHERSADGVIVRSIGMIQDITERKQAEEKAAEHLRELEQWYRATLNREDRVLELKNEINTLLEKLGEQPKYGKLQA